MKQKKIFFMDNFHLSQEKIINISGKYVIKRVSVGSKECTKELKLECAYFLGQTS